MLIAAITAVVLLTALVAAAGRRHNRRAGEQQSKIAARIDEQIAATNGRPHLPHVEVSPIDPPYNPPTG